MSGVTGTLITVAAPADALAAVAGLGGVQMVERWSPRAFTGEAMPQDQLMSLFEAARWAPSAFNAQPWRFLVGRVGAELLRQREAILVVRQA